jgi:hypothetical protein
VTFAAVRRNVSKGSGDQESARRQRTPRPAQAHVSSSSGTVSAFSAGKVQRAVKVGAPGDAAEKEAERTAEHVTSGPVNTAPRISRFTISRLANSDNDTLRRKMPDVHEQEEAAEGAAVHRAVKSGGEEASVHRNVQQTPSEPVAQPASQQSQTQPREMEEQAPRRPSGTASIYRKPMPASDSADVMQRKAAGDMDAAAGHAISTKGEGAPLRPHVRRVLESRMGADFSGVRVHEGPAARESAAALNARAFTHQGDIWLGKGESQDNLNLMAHEATHVVQQGAAATPAAAVAGARTAVVPAAGPVVSAPPATPDSPAPAHPAGANLSAAPSASAASGAAAPAVPAKAGGKTPALPAPGEKAKGESGPAGADSAAEAGPQGADAKSAKKSPDADPAFQAVVTKVKKAAANQKAHAPVSQNVAAAHAAVESSSNEVPSRAAAKQTDVIDQQKPNPFNRAAFKAALLEKIEKTAPRSLEDADDFKSNHPLDTIKPDLSAQVADEKKQSQGPVAEKVEAQPDTSGIEPKPVVPLPAPETGAPPQVAAAGAAPKPASEEDISLQAGPKEIDQQMASADVTEEQLKDSNEPAFQGALAQKKDVEKESVASPQAYRAEEPKLLQAAQSDAQSLTTKDVHGMHGVRMKDLGGVTGKQTDAKAEEEKRRAKIFGDIQGIYGTTKSNVEKRLKDLDTEVNTAFDAGAAEAQQAFEDYVDARMSAYKDERYDGATGKLKWAKDKLWGMPDEVNKFYLEGHDLYVGKMDKVIDHVATLVEIGLNQAKDMVSAGKAAIQTYLEGLPQAEKDTGQKAAEGIQSQFESLDQSIANKEGELIDSLAKKYNENLQKVNARIDEMKQANKGLVDKVVGAIKGVIETIRQLKNMLLNVLSRAAAAIGLIIAHPIKFLGHLVDAGIRGFNNFKDHILDHLKEGFMQWLFGAVAAIGIELPKTFDLAGILSLVLQVLGLTYANIRARAVSILGEKVVKALETTAEIFKILITKGPGGLWDYIKDQLGNLVDTVIDSIKSFIMEKVIVAGITWLIGLLNPASAFVKACKAIYDIIMFFVERGSQILDLVNAIIDSITAIANGKIDQAANWIEKSLARAIPVIIGFLASLLGVGGISEKIKEVIDKIRKPVNIAIDWVINKAASIAMAIGGALGFGGKHDQHTDGQKRPDARSDEQKKDDLAKALKEAQGAQEDQDKTDEQVKQELGLIKEKYNMVSLQLVVDSEAESEETVHIEGQINPPGATPETKREKNEWPRGTHEDPIPIKWYKPIDIYPNIGGNGPEEGVMLPESSEKGGRRGERWLQVSSTNFLVLGQVLSRREPGRPPDAKKGEIYRRLSDEYDKGRNGLKVSTGPDYAIDHVRDLAWFGQDTFTNLWPLKSSVNNAVNASHNQTAKALVRGKPQAHSVKAWGAGTYFRIAKIEDPPGSSGGHGTDADNPVNSGKQGVPKRMPG